MKIDVEVHLHGGQGESSKLTQIADSIAQLAAQVSSLITQGIIMTKEFDALQTEVERNTTVDGSVQVLLTGLAAQIAALKNDPAKLQALADQLKASNDATAAAVTANTPADETGGAPA